MNNHDWQLIKIYNKLYLTHLIYPAYSNGYIHCYKLLDFTKDNTLKFHYWGDQPRINHDEIVFSNLILFFIKRYHSIMLKLWEFKNRN